MVDAKKETIRTTFFAESFSLG
jgi:hypothetical protein